MKAAGAERLRALRSGGRSSAGAGIWLDGLRSDLGQVVRALAHARAFTAVAVVTFALGMGVNIAVFSVFDKLLFRPLPFAHPERLVQIHTRVLTGAEGRLPWTTYAEDFALRDEASSLAGIAWDFGSSVQTGTSGGENPLVLTWVTTNVLDVLGVRPIRGRGFEPADQTLNGGDTAVMLTWETWRSRFGGSNDVVSRSWDVDGRRYRVIGVLPPGFFLPSSRFVEHRDGLYVMRQTPPRNGLITVAPFARLRDGVSLSTAQAELDAIMQRHGFDKPKDAGQEPIRIVVQPLRSGLSIIVGPYLWLTSWAVWLVLAVACVNLSTLLLMRARSRRRLAAVRAALGASPSRLLRLSLLEAVVLCLGGGAAGWLLCVWMGQWIVTVLPSTLHGFAVTPFDPRIVAISLAVTGGSAFLAGALPALASGRVDILTVLRGDSAGVHRRTPLGAGRMFLGLEAAFGVLVVVGAAVTVPAFARLMLQPTGLDARDLYTVSLTRARDDGLSTDARVERALAILDIVAAQPRVERAAVAFSLPYRGVYVTSPGEPPGSAFWAGHGSSGYEWVFGAGMFDTIGTPIRAGREFSPADIAGALPVAMVNETGARLLWPGTPLTAVVGRPIDATGGTRRTVIGVSADVRTTPGTAASPALYLPLTAPEARPAGWELPLVVRMTPGAVPNQELMAARLHERFPNNRARVSSVASQFAPILDRPRFLALLFGVLAGIALLLAGIGVYAVAAFETVNRRHELAIRLALGASVGRLGSRLGAEILLPALAGTAMGLVAAALGAHAFRAQVAELQAVDPAVFLAAALINVAATVGGVWGPARQAARVDPAAELRAS